MSEELTTSVVLLYQKKFVAPCVFVRATRLRYILLPTAKLYLKKYSPVGELSAFASQYAEVLSRVSGLPVIICDKDHVIAASGVSKRELLERRVSPVLENYMESRKSYTATQATVGDIQPVEGVEHRAAVIYPIIAAGDVTGAVVMLMGEDNKVPTETEVKLAHSAAAFLGKQMEE